MSMQVKGSSVAPRAKFVLEKFGQEKYNAWLDSLSPESKQIFQDNILISSWYPLRAGLAEPTKKICDMFYNGNPAGAREIGIYSAEYALKGVYGLLAKFSSPKFLTERAADVFTRYYQPCELKAGNFTGKSATITITKFDELDSYIENNWCGYVQRALEINGCKNVKVNITKSMAKGDPATEMAISWE